MPMDTTKILAGAGIFSIGTYVTAGGPGTLTDVGHIKSPYELGGNFENFDIETERAQGIVKTSPTKADFTFKVAFHQAEAEWLRVSLGQPAGNLAAGTLRVGDRVEQYHQGTLQCPGPTSATSRLLTFWKMQVVSIEPISFGKGIEQLYVTTFRIMRDDSVATADKYFKQVDS